MSINDQLSRHLTKRQISERAQIKARKPSVTIQSETPAQPEEGREEIEAPLNPKTKKQKMRSARIEAILHAHESSMTLSGLTDAERLLEKNWLEQEGKRLRGQ